MSPMAPLKAEKATERPSGLMSGDSGMSTAFSSTRLSMSPETALWSTSVLCFSVRTK